MRRAHIAGTNARACAGVQVCLIKYIYIDRRERIRGVVTKKKNASLRKIIRMMNKKHTFFM